MKKLFVLLFLSASFALNAQETIKPAEKGVVYGETISASGNAISVNELQSKLQNNVFEGKITGKVKEVCKAMGCWIKLEKADGSTLMVKSKDHQFFMPENIVGKTVVVEGAADVQEVSEAKRKHYAKDAGKSEKEIKKIKGAQNEVQFVASGVQVID